MQTMEQSTLHDRIQSVIGNPILLPVSRSCDLSAAEILPFDPHTLPDEFTEDVSESPSSLINREIATRASETIANGLLGLFGDKAQALPRCKPYVRAFISTRLEGVAMAAELPCGSWECQRCGPKLKLKWYQRHVAYVADARFLEKIYIDKDDWGATHRMINRQGEGYLKYEQHDGSILILTSARLGGTEVKPADREYELVKALVGTAYARQPVSQSRNWGDGSPTAEPAQNWKPLDSTRFTSLDDLIVALTARGIPTSTHSIYSRTFGSLRAATFKIPNAEFWHVLWSIGALARHCPSAGPRENRDTLWEWGPPRS